MLGSRRVRGSSVALALGLVVALGLVWVVDRLIARDSRMRAELEAVEAAVIAQSFLAVHVQALRMLPLVAGDVGSSPFPQSVEALRAHAPGFDHMWVADSNGVVQREHLSPDQGAMSLLGADIDTIARFGLTTRLIRATRRGQIVAGRATTGQPGFLLVEPLYRAGRLVGFVGGSIPGERFLGTVGAGRAHRSGRLLVMRGADTVVVEPLPTTVATSYDVAGVAIRSQGSSVDSLRIAIVRPSEAVRLRVLVWVVGLATILSIVLVMRDERHQAQRLAERTTELERLSTELLRANRAKSEFLANVSHELRTPLNAIVGFVDLLRDGVYGELAPRQVGPVDRIAASATHLRQLVDQVLDIAKMAAGRLEVHPEAIELRPFVLDVVSEVETLISERGLNLSLAIPATLPKVESDPLHLRQILVNLLANALQYTPTGGVAVRGKLVRDADDVRRWVMLQVADSGIGIAPSDLERIFEEFEQVNAGPRSDSMRRGTGLGLAISRRLARLLGGDVTVESELGKGSTFTVWLPVATVGVEMGEPEESGRERTLVR
jgi:signal transduction histidine kinase